MTSNLGAQRPLLLYPHLSPRAGHSFCLCVGFSICSFLQWDEGIPPCSTVPHLDTYTNKNTVRSNKRGAPWKIWGKIARLLDAPVNSDGDPLQQAESWCRFSSWTWGSSSPVNSLSPLLITSPFSHASFPLACHEAQMLRNCLSW